MSVAFVDKLLESFDKLERCITVTEEVLAKKPDVPAEVLARVQQYATIVRKQRELAGQLEAHLEAQNWAEVSRHVKIINGLSGMIRDDAQEILASSGGLLTDAADTPQLC
ncbi:MAG: hypothetical protein KDD44_13510 [Bdellovibrionales bacterium]|nr:hypothetical protein [Bdellovibrionales bacterium]